MLKIPISQQKKDVEHQEGGELKKKEITPVEEFMKRARDKYKLKYNLKYFFFFKKNIHFLVIKINVEYFKL